MVLRPPPRLRDRRLARARARRRLCRGLSPTWIAGAYADGWQPPLLVAAMFAGLSLAMAFAYWRLDSGRDALTHARLRAAFAWRDFYRFGPAFWQLLALCMLWYAVIFAFRSTFSIKFSSTCTGSSSPRRARSRHGLPRRTVRDAILRLALRPLRAPGAVARLRHAAAATRNAGDDVPALPLWVGTVLIGISYSLVPAVLWPLASRFVPPRGSGSRSRSSRSASTSASRAQTSRPASSTTRSARALPIPRVTGR